MQVIFESRDAEARQMRDRSVERVRFAFRRLTNWVPRVKVLFTDINGPRGGVDKRCQVEMNTEAAGTVVVVALASDWRTALDLSLGRATRVLRHNLRRNQKPARGNFAPLAIDS